MLFELFEKDDQQKNCVRFFKIFSVGFFYILEKRDKQENCAWFFESL